MNDRSFLSRLVWSAPSGVFAGIALSHGFPWWVWLGGAVLNALGYIEARSNPL
jgi:hypothetical protein